MMQTERITIESINNLHPCGWDREDNGKNYTPRRVRELYEGTDKAGVTPLGFIERATKLKVPPEDILWVLLRPQFLPERDLEELSCLFALWSLHFFEEAYPNDDRPRKAIETKQRRLHGKISDKELKAARAAAAEAAEAAWAALLDILVDYLKGVNNER